MTAARTDLRPSARPRICGRARPSSAGGPAYGLAWTATGALVSSFQTARILDEMNGLYSSDDQPPPCFVRAAATPWNAVCPQSLASIVTISVGVLTVDGAEERQRGAAAEDGRAGDDA